MAKRHLGISFKLLAVEFIGKKINSFFLDFDKFSNMRTQHFGSFQPLDCFGEIQPHIWNVFGLNERFRFFLFIPF